MQPAAGSIVRTVLGDVDPSSVGIALCHEHLAVDISWAFDDPDLRLDNPDDVAEDLAEAMSLGLKTVVDATALGMGRNPISLKRIAEITGLNVLASAGFYFGRFLPDYVMDRSEAELAAQIAREVEEGIDGSGVKAGAIGEIGNSSTGISEVEAKLFRAVGRAQKRTAAPIITHTDSGRFASQQLDLLEAGGADAAHVLVGHMDCTADAEAHRAVVERGAFIGFDRITLTGGVFGPYQTDETRIESIVRLVEAGFAAQIILSHDLARKTRLMKYGGSGYSHVLREFVPRLREAGLDESTIQMILIDNPRRLLAFTPTAPPM